MGFSGSGSGSGGGVSAWQFQPETYGALGNGKVINDVTTNATSVVTSPTIGAEGSAAVGKYIMIHGANGGTNNGPYVGTITAVAGNNITLSGTAPTASVANCPAVYGTDDVAAINAAISAAKTYALAHNYHAEVLFAPSIYILGSGPTQQTTPAQYSTQILIPYPDLLGNTRKLVIALTGTGDNGYAQYWQSLVPNLSGTCFVSMLLPNTAAANSGTFGRMSVIGGPSAGGAFTGSFANTKISCKNINVFCAIYTNLIAWDTAYLAAARWVQCSASVFAPTGTNLSAVQPYRNVISATSLLNSIGIGFRTPSGGNNADVTMDDVTAQGYELGFLIFDHFTASRLLAVDSDVAVKWDSSIGISGTQHGLFIQEMTAENYNGGLRTNGGLCQVDITWDSENSGVPAYDVNDGANALFGNFWFGDKIDNRAPSVTGGANLKVINMNLGPGHWASPPAVPASGTPQQNTAWRDAGIVVHTGVGVTVSAITVDGTVTGLTMAASSSLALPNVPAGKNVTLTYAGGTPTWDWWLL